MKRLLLALFFIPSLASAEPVEVKRFITASNTSTAAYACTTLAPSACKVKNAALLDTVSSWTMEVAGYSKLILQIDHTYVAATAIGATCEGSINGGSTYARITSTSILAGTGTVSAYTDSYATGGASTNILLEYGIQGYSHVRCDLSDTAATTDTVTVYANVSRGE